jgi:hypothetical protein
MVNKKLIEGINHFFQHPFLANKSPNFWHFHTFLFIWKISIPKTLEEQAAWSLRMGMKGAYKDPRLTGRIAARGVRWDTEFTVWVG